MKLTFQRLLREPLLHFILIGGLMFAVYTAMNEPAETPPEVIIISSDRIAQIKASYSAVWKREPSDEEVAAMIDEEVREEVYYRDGVSLGLDRNDSIVRRRIRLKMEFLMDNSAHAMEPAEGELETYFAANVQDYKTELQIAFEQVYLGKKADTKTIANVLDELNTNPAADPFLLGKQILLPEQMGFSTQADVYGVFGKGFFAQLTELEANVWAGPVKSTYGIHLVRIIDMLPVSTPPLNEVRDDVLKGWKAQKRSEISDLDYAKRRKKYVVEISPDDQQPAGTQ